MLKLWAFGIVLLMAFPAAAQERTRPSATIKLSCTMLPLVTDGLLNAHMSFSKEDDALLKRVATTYANFVDSTKTILTQKEYNELEARVFKAGKAMRTGDCEEFSKLHADRLKWQRGIRDHVKSLLDDKKYAINKKATLELDTRKRKRPRNAKEQDALRRLVVDFQIANYVASDTSLEEAKTKLVKRYDLQIKRIEEEDEAAIFRDFLNAYATSLDPHSTYFSPDDLDDFKIQMELSLTGIGAVLTSQDGYTIIQEIVAGGPAERNGRLQPKDKIIAVAQGDGEPVDVIDMDLRDVVKMIRGKKDTTVMLTVLRQSSETERFRVAIQRDKIDLKDQAAKLEWKEIKRGDKTLKLAVIDLPSFYKGEGTRGRDCAKDVAQLVEEARKAKADGILLDLSKNGGGVLQSAVKITGLFIEAGAIVGVGTGVGAPEVLVDYDPRIQWEGPLVVLTSKASASASEILAGALQDYNRAVIVGDAHTYGKGSVQQMNPLPAGLGLLKVTTAKFYLPGGKSTQNIGVISDVVIPSVLAPIEIGEKHLPHALPPATTKDFKSDRVNTGGKWNPVTRPTITRLAKLSGDRVKQSEEFKELAKKITKSGSGKTSLKISDILENKEPEEKKEEDQKKADSLQRDEALEILADLITDPTK